MHLEKTFIAVVPNAPFFLWGDSDLPNNLEKEKRVGMLDCGKVCLYTIYQ